MDPMPLPVWSCDFAKSFEGLLNHYYGVSDAGDNHTRRFDIIAGGNIGGVELLAMASRYDQAGIFSRDRAISQSADGRSRGGIDQRSSATPNGRILVDDSILVLKDGLKTGVDQSDFRQATSEDLLIIPVYPPWFRQSGFILSLGKPARAGVCREHL